MDELQEFSNWLEWVSNTLIDGYYLRIDYLQSKIYSMIAARSTLPENFDITHSCACGGTGVCSVCGFGVKKDNTNEIGTTLLPHEWREDGENIWKCLCCGVVSCLRSPRPGDCPARMVTESSSPENMSTKSENLKVSDAKASELPEATCPMIDSIVEWAYRLESFQRSPSLESRRAVADELETLMRLILAESAKQAREVADERIAAARIETQAMESVPFEVDACMCIIPGGDS